MTNDVQTGRVTADTTAGELIAQGQTVQQMQTPYATAVKVQRPRDLRDVLNRCLVEAEIGGDSMYYRWETTSTDKKTGEVKKSYIEGPSVNMALMIARNMGNAVVVQRPVQETRTGFVFTAAFVDLETGFTIERQFRMDKNFPVYGKMDQFRKDDIRFQIGQSKAIRNVVNNAINSGILSKCLDAAKASVRAKIEDEIARESKGGKDGKMVVFDRMLTAFGKFGVAVQDIERKLGMPSARWDIDEMVLLYGDLKALKEGTETAESLYGAEVEPEDQPAGGLSTNQMQPGDASTHTPYDKGKASKAPKGELEL